MSEPEGSFLRLIIYFGIVYYFLTIVSNLIDKYGYLIIPKKIRLRRDIIKKLSDEGGQKCLVQNIS